jgi:hypothetical protein
MKKDTNKGIFSILNKIDKATSKAFGTGDRIPYKPKYDIDDVDEVEEEEVEEENNIYEQATHKTAYEYAWKLCRKVRNDGSALFGSKTPVTARILFIVEQLNNLGINYQIVPFVPDFYQMYTRNNFHFKNNKLVNVNVFFKATKRTKKTIIFTAHHDIANPRSDNLQDNSASVSNLIYLCDKINRMKERNKNVFVVFTDCEEFGGKGATHFCQQINSGELGNFNVEGIIDLELTAVGTELWTEVISPDESKLMKKIKKLYGEMPNQFRTPYNQAMTMRGLGQDAICIGILPKSDIRSLKKGFYCKNWALCHSPLDVFENANKTDMNRLVNLLKRFVNE